MFHGPYMDDFLDAVKLLEKYDGNVEVNGHDDFAEKAIHFLSDTALLKQKGLAAKKALTDNLHASKNHARVIAGLIKD